MIPHSFPTQVSSNTGRPEMIVYYLSDVTGLSRWVDYIPVRTVQIASEIPTENTTNSAGFEAVSPLSSTSGKVSWRDYVPVYEDGSATTPFTTDTNGYIPVGLSGAGGASLVLNFAYRKALDSRITFTRASSATYFDANGVLQSATTNTARFDHDPVTGICKGLLIEEARTNLLLHSRDLTQSAWVKTDVTPMRNQIGIDGVANTACLMTEGSAGNAACRQDATVTAGSTITVSRYLKKGNTDWVRFQVFGNTFSDGANGWFNLASGSAGTVSAVGAATNVSSSITPIGGGWYRCSVTVTPSGSYTTAINQVTTAAGNANVTRVSGGTYIVDANQLEAGSFATSYIPTTTASATRSADVASMTGTNFSDWFNASEGTFVVVGTPMPTAAQRAFASVDDGTLNNRIEMAINSGNFSRDQVFTVGVSQSDMLSAGTYVGQLKKAVAYKLNDFAKSDNGSSVVTDGSATVPVVDRLSIGNRSSGGVVFNGHISRIAFYPVRLSNSILQGLTT